MSVRKLKMQINRSILSLVFVLVIYISTQNTFAASSAIDNHSWDHPCLENQFECETGDCISQTKRCDGKVHCPDLSDEANCNHTDTVLKPEEYPCYLHVCGDGTCLPYNKLCDYLDDCDDDETNCKTEEERECESNSQFTCSYGLGGCIPQSEVCNGINDCGDLSDEEDCTDADTDLSLEDDPCDLSDEEDCNYMITGLNPEDYPCSNHSQAYLCDDKTCLPKGKVCDGVPHCDSDESFCHGGHQCDPEENFGCKNGECIDHDWVCDGDNDCGDLSDELNCCEFTCESTGTCLLKHMRCDGNIDCGDLSDEKYCHIGHPNENRTTPVYFE